MPQPLSILDLTPLVPGSTSTESLAASVALAQHAEALGYTRVWYAEHHGLPGIVSTAPDLMIAHVAAHTRHIRLGSGGVMLPNHAPLRIAEAYRMLEALHPGRIDLGIGRAPGTNAATAQALRRGRTHDDFPQQLAELEAWGLDRIEGISAAPTDVRLPPIWLLGSSEFSARLAASNGFPYAFASHFSPTPPDPVMALYRQGFQPHEDRSDQPRSILAVAAFVADTLQEAERLARPWLVTFVRLRTGKPIVPLSEAEAEAVQFTPYEAQIARVIRQMMHLGTPEQVVAEVGDMADRTAADEVMVVTNSGNTEARLRSYRLFMEAWQARNARVAS